MTSGRERQGRGRGGLAEEICRAVADEIVLGVLTPGARLDEMTLAARFNVSRTPVREALRQLASAGLIETRPNRGCVVVELNKDAVDEMFEAIGELEAACARHAALRMTDDDRALMMACQAECRAAMQDGDVDRYDAANRGLHHAILLGSHNSVLIDLVTRLRNRIAPFRRSQFRNIERMGESFEEHSLIVEAILTHDVLRAYREMRSHLLSARSAATRVASTYGAKSRSDACENEK
jgi:DNA-binding GntR family transcriptional regulator